MWILSVVLILAFNQIALYVHSFEEGNCLRKGPLPGVLVLPPGRKVVLDCGGQVVVDGSEVNVLSVTHRAESVDGSVNVADHNGIGTSSRPSVTLQTKTNERRSVRTITSLYHGHPTGVESVENGTEIYGGPEKNHLEYKEPEDNILAATSTFRPIIRRSTTKSQSELTADETDREDDYEKGEEGERRVRGLRRTAEWQWDGTGPITEGGREGLTLSKSGSTLTLSSLSEGDSGNYSCHRRGKMLFSLRVIVAAPPEHLTLSCFKRSPSSKIRCDGIPRQPISPPPQCFLFIRKGYFSPLSLVNCSYSILLSRCWCALEHLEEERRVPHMASMCATNTAGKATSSTLDFTPLDIIKPDPPSSVVVQCVEGQDRILRVTWRKPYSWKDRDNFYMLNYQISYRPLKSQHAPQVVPIKMRSFTIRDAEPGLEYVIQIRAKDEFDGQWSAWTTPVYTHTWRAPVPTALSDNLVSRDTGYEYTEGSGIADSILYASESAGVADKAWHHVLWVIGVCVLLSAFLIVYLSKHKARFVSKLESLRFTPVSQDSTPPVPVLHEGHAQLNDQPPCFEKPVRQDVNEEVEVGDEEKEYEERTEAIHFNNTSYFLVMKDCTSE